jgi:NAD-reducing hydrogenase small subunit
MDRVKLATVWFGGCSGCHMSFLDMDEFLIEIADKIELVYSPLMDIKEYPKNVDIVFIEGAIANDEQLHFVKNIRQKSKIVISFGDCAITGNVTAMRNPLGDASIILNKGYIENATTNPQIPSENGVLPVLLDRVKAIHEIIPVDVFIPGCPPPADRIKFVIEKLLANEKPVLEGINLKNG